MTRDALAGRPDTRYSTEETSAREAALRKLPLRESLALRLRDAGVASEVVCGSPDSPLARLPQTLDLLILAAFMGCRGN